MKVPILSLPPLLFSSVSRKSSGTIDDTNAFPCTVIIVFTRRRVHVDSDRNDDRGNGGMSVWLVVGRSFVFS